MPTLQGSPQPVSRKPYDSSKFGQRRLEEVGTMGNSVGIGMMPRWLLARGGIYSAQGRAARPAGSIFGYREAKHGVGARQPDGESLRFGLLQPGHGSDR